MNRKFIPAVPATQSEAFPQLYRATPCGCHHRLCTAWHVSPVADVQGVSFTEQQARDVAELLNRKLRETV